MFYQLEKVGDPIPSTTTELRINTMTRVMTLPELPAGLLSLHCVDNDLIELPALPEGLLAVTVYGNKLLLLPELPASLRVLFVHNNPLNAFYGTFIDEYERTGDIAKLRKNISDHRRKTTKYVSYRGSDEKRYTEIPSIPEDTAALDVFFNPSLSSLPPLPKNLLVLNTSFTAISTLPALPSTLLELDCSHSLLTTLPELPADLDGLNCSGNRDLTEIPALPSGLRSLSFGRTGVAKIPKLPSTMKVFDATEAPLVEPFATYFAEYQKTLDMYTLISQVNSQYA